jgi:hypothetical protein
MTIPSISPSCVPENITKGNLLSAIEVIQEVVVRVLFIYVSIVMSASLLPLSFHAIALPIVALSSTFMAAHFYPDPRKPFTQPKVLEEAAKEAQVVESLPAVAALKGFVNGMKNCAICSCLQLLLSDPEIERWLRSQPPFDAFFASESVQALREALHRISPSISPLSNVQLDPAEVMMAMFTLLPERLKLNLTIHTHLRGNPDLLYYRPPRNVTCGFLVFDLPKNEESHDLQELLRFQLNTPGTHQISAVGKDHLVHNYDVDRTETILTEAPSAIRIQIARFGYLRKCWGLIQRPFKREDLIEAPEELIIPVRGEQRHYRLTGFVSHIGASIHDGHCIAGRIVDGGKHIFSDERVTPATQEQWEQLLQRAYLLSYQPV